MKNTICIDNLPQIMSSLEFLFIHEQSVKFLFVNYSDLLVNFFEEISLHSCHAKELIENILVFWWLPSFSQL